MFYRDASDQYMLEGVAFEVDGVGYPCNWLNLSTPEEKLELGLEEVMAVGERLDDRYYWITEHLNKATITYTNEAKPMDECKATAIAQINNTAYTLLLPSDWMTTRKLENGTEVPQEWLDYREAVRVAAAQGIADVEAATTIEEIEAVVVNWPVSPDAPVQPPAPAPTPEDVVVEEPVVDPVPEEPVVEEPVVEEPAP